MYRNFCIDNIEIYMKVHPLKALHISSCTGFNIINDIMGLVAQRHDGGYRANKCSIHPIILNELKLNLGC